MSQDFTGQLIKETYQRVVQVSGSTTKYLLDGTGSLIQNLELKNAVLSGSTEISGSLIFQPKDPAYVAGQLYYNNTEYTLDFQTGIDEVTLQIGQETFVRARNATGATITNGQAVRISGVQGNRPKVDLAISAIDWSAQRDAVQEILGVATHDIPDNSDGFITTFGLVRNVDTSAYTNGDLLYLSNTTSGSYDTTAPPVPYDNIFIGTVINSSATQGIIFANPREAIHLHDISHISQSIKPSTNDVLVFNGTYWEKGVNRAFDRDSNQDSMPITGSFYDVLYEMDSNGDIQPKDLQFWLDGNFDINPI